MLIKTTITSTVITIVVRWQVLVCIRHNIPKLEIQTEQFDGEDDIFRFGIVTNIKDKKQNEATNSVKSETHVHRQRLL